MTHQSIDIQTAKHWLANKEAVLIDVREPAEYASKHIPGSLLLPVSSCCSAALPEYSKGKKIVVHCQKGGRGAMACEKLTFEDAGLELYNLEGGILAWEAAGLPVNSAKRQMLSLDRQVQLTIGIILIVGSLLAYYVSSLFLLLTGFVGVGLTVAGATGFCGLAQVLAKMPWNQSRIKSCCVIK
ncbi:MAG: rhodanese-like domain-containing protein [Alphaproteobacteria bacterium]